VPTIEDELLIGKYGSPTFEEEGSVKLPPVPVGIMVEDLPV
jgi:hypothetical protein